jgi:hypothetical protein
MSNRPAESQAADRKHTLVDEGLLKLVEELEVEEIFRCEGLLTDDGLHGLHVLADGVASVLNGFVSPKNKNT